MDKMSAPDASPPLPTPSPPVPSPNKSQLPKDYEYDFVEEPPKEFYCAVSFQLLLSDPQQTDCCGHHFTLETADLLKRDGKPCPICKAPQLTTHADLHHKRRVNEVAVRCPHKATGKCDWVGELGNLPYHVANCPKQPWKCTHCTFSGSKEAESKHISTCKMVPVKCPKKCNVGMIPRSQLDQHKLVCPLEEVDCEYANFGCSKKLLRKDLKNHLVEGEKEHLLKMCALNLGLTQQLVKKVEEKDRQIEQLQTQLLAMKDELKQSMEKLQESTSSSLLTLESHLETQVKGVGDQMTKHMCSMDSSIDSVKSCLVDVQHQMDAMQCTLPPIEFTVTNFAALRHHKLEWRSPPFYSHHGGYKMCMGVSPNGVHKGCGTHVSLRFYKMLDLNSDSLKWNVKIRLKVHVQNQNTKAWEKEYVDDSMRSKPDAHCVGSSAEYNYLRHSELNSYVKNDQLHLRVSEFKVLLE